VFRNRFAVANALNREKHNHFIQKVIKKLLCRVSIAGNTRVLFFLGCKNLFEPQITVHYVKKLL